MVKIEFNDDFDFDRKLKEILWMDKEQKFSTARFEMLKFLIIKTLIDFHPANGINKRPFNECDLKRAFIELDKEAKKWEGMRLN